ncbi:MAG: HAMP domain-containing sensor histidine kinase [Candidatus Pacebacteria bacterium]|nr:HAMP domain-containing sensor histidine kinase [Candidatus Paceibacterota bacterium]
MVGNYASVLLALPLALILILVEGWDESRSRQTAVTHSRVIALQSLSNDLANQANRLDSAFLPAGGCWGHNTESIAKFNSLGNQMLGDFPYIQSLFWLHLESDRVTIEQSLARTQQPITSVKLDQRPSFRFALDQAGNGQGITASPEILLPFYYTPTYGHLLLPEQKLTPQCDIVVAELNLQRWLDQLISPRPDDFPDGSYSLNDRSPRQGNPTAVTGTAGLSQAIGFFNQSWSLDYRPPPEAGTIDWRDYWHYFIALLVLIGGLRCIQQCVTLRRIPSLSEFKQMILHHQSANHFYSLQIRDLEDKIRELKQKLAIVRGLDQSDSPVGQIQTSAPNPKQQHDEQIMTLGRIVAGVAHEINTPLGVALTATSVVEKQIQKVTDIIESQKTNLIDPQLAIQMSLVEKNLKICRDASQHIKPTIQRATSLIQNLKQISTSPQLAPARRVNLSLVITEIMNSLKLEIRRAGHRLELELPEQLMIATRPDSLWQVLSNLSMNSINHGFNQGESGTITVKAFAQNQRAVIEFSDNGRGIPPEIGKKIFEPFFTTSRQKGGSGLGLSIVVSLLLQSLEGTIDYVNLEPKGTRFILTLGNVKDSTE